jgi:hypothetical protein
MRKLSAFLSLAALPLLVQFAAAQTLTGTPRLPAAVPGGYFASLNSTPQHRAQNRLSAATNLATQAQSQNIVSIPTFSSSFTSDGQSYAYTMVGQNPALRRMTSVPTEYVPLSFYFDEFVDQNGNNITIDATTNTRTIKNSPLFDDAEYASGDTQFVDAQMRAQFWPLTNTRRGDNNYHVLLGTPQTLTPVTIEVPYGASQMFVDPSGTYFALIDVNFIESQLNTMLQLEPVDARSIPIFMTRNAVYGDFSMGQPVDCCVGGFHTAYEARQTGNRTFVQTVVFATSLDSDVANSVFGDPGEFADINALSHELAETVNDPFANNLTPSYQVPGAPQGVCQDLLEVGDITESFIPDYTDVTLHWFTYHPQTLGVMQWFADTAPSTAINGDFSFPDSSLLTTQFTPCSAIVPVG